MALNEQQKEQLKQIRRDLDELRAPIDMARAAAPRAIEVLRELAEDESLPARQRQKAASLLLRYSLAAKGAQ